MTDLVVLSDAEIAVVAGGAVTQSVSVTVTQYSRSNIATLATATNVGRVTESATGSRINAALLRVNPVRVAVVPPIDVFKILQTAGLG